MTKLSIPNLTILSHPLLTHMISLLRDINTPCAEFRKIFKEIAIMKAY